MTLARVLLIIVALFAIAQLVPYGRDHTNPPVVAEPTWDSPQTRETFYTVCRDCHTNETTWPWYASVAPASWLVQHDVEEGRAHLNVSDWTRERPKQHGDDTSEEVEEQEMPPWYYLPLHPEAQLTPEQRAAFVAGLEATFGKPHHRKAAPAPTE